MQDTAMLEKSPMCAEAEVATPEDGAAAARASEAEEAGRPEPGPSPDEVVQKIQEEQRKIAGHEGDVLGSLVAIGLHLVALKSLAKCGWARRLKTVGMSTRQASRLMKVGQRWGREIGPNGADLRQRLPIDDHKCEALCKLSYEQLMELADRLDLKKASRKEVCQAVRQALGEQPRRREPSFEDVSAKVGQQLGRLKSTVARWRQDSPPDDQRATLGDKLATGLQSILEELRPGVITEQADAPEAH
jgi:hypothetical protein